MPIGRTRWTSRQRRHSPSFSKHGDSGFSSKGVKKRITKENHISRNQNVGLQAWEGYIVVATIKKPTGRSYKMLRNDIKTGDSIARASKGDHSLHKG